jgi:glycosyltransferase involved in cell wall biosynthesis
MQSGRDLQELYAGAAVFVFASEVDTFGLVTMEAMASGAPVLVPRSSSIAGVVEHRQNAYCYELGVAGLREALLEVLNDDQLAATLSRNGRAAMVARWEATQGRSPWLESANG